MIFSAISAGLFSICAACSRKPIFSNSKLTRRIMRFSAFTILAITASINLLFLFTAPVFGQGKAETLIKISFGNEKLTDALKTIEQNTNFRFAYHKADIETLRTPVIPLSQYSIGSLMHLMLDNNGLTFRIINKNILVTKKSSEKAATAKSPTNFEKPDDEVIGIVTDLESKPLPGVTIISKNNPANTISSDVNGHFHLFVQGNDVLIFSYIGFKTLEVQLAGNNPIEVRLTPAIGNLDEVQIIGYGKTTKKLNTGSVSSITADEIAKQTVDNPLTALQGRIAGLQITQDNGLPGGGVRVQIRGQNSLGAGTMPLYVIDGVPFTLFNGSQPPSDALNAYGSGGANGDISPFSLINPQDIERIDVLKDADATSIYGSRGANGVILITTKKGTSGKTVVAANVYSGIAKVGHYIPMMNTEQYLAMRRQAFANSGVTPDATNAPDLVTWDQNAYTDWQKYLLGGTAHTTDATASVTGGSPRNSFLFSTTYRDQGTVFPGSYGAKTFSNRINTGHRSLDGKFSIDFSANYVYNKNEMPAADLSTYYNLAPNMPLYNADGTLNFTSGGNPAAIFKKSYNSSTTNLISNLNLKYQLFTGFSLKANLGYTLTDISQILTNPASSQKIDPNATQLSLNAANNATFSENKNSNYIIEPQAEYVRMLGRSKINILLGTTFQSSLATGQSILGTNFAGEDLLNSLTNAGTLTALSNNYSLYKYTAFFGRLNYNFDDRYLIDGTFRRDGSSRFGPNHRFGNFGAVGAAWVFSNEEWLKGNELLSFGKFRGSYGITGNDQIPNYLYMQTYSSGYYNYLGSNILTVNTIPNPNLQWESTKKLDIALELGFFKDRVTLKTDYYLNRSSNQLLTVLTPAQSGYSGYTANFPAVIQNKGWEFELGVVGIENKDFRIFTAVNLSINRNKLVAYPDLATSSYSNTLIIGQPLDVVQGFHYTGVNPANGEPTFLTSSPSGYPDYQKDRKVLPIGFPYFGGLSNSITYKGFSMDFTFQFNHRNGFTNSTLSQNFYPYGYDAANQSTAILNRWVKPGDKAFYPAAGVNPDPLYGALFSSDYYWGDASYIKFKTLSFSYKLSAKWLNSAGISSANVYLQGQNLYTWSAQKYTYDPDSTQPGTGIGLGTGQYISFPQLRTVVLGINFSL